MSGLAPDFWETRFREGGTPWERAGLHPAFLAWRRSGVLSPCRVVVPGAGRSPEPMAMQQAGFDVVAVDLAPSAVGFQAGLLGRERAVQADVTAWVPERPFDAVYDQTCLCALPPALWAGYARQVRRWVRPGGRLFLLRMETGTEGGPPFDCPEERVRALFEGWAWAEAGDAVPHGLGGTETPVVLTLPG